MKFLLSYILFSPSCVKPNEKKNSRNNLYKFPTLFGVCENHTRVLCVKLSNKNRNDISGDSFSELFSLLCC